VRCATQSTRPSRLAAARQTVDEAGGIDRFPFRVTVDPVDSRRHAKEVFVLKVLPVPYGAPAPASAAERRMSREHPSLSGSRVTKATSVTDRRLGQSVRGHHLVTLRVAVHHHGSSGSETELAHARRNGGNQAVSGHCWPDPHRELLSLSRGHGRQ
jgi:hypothetical protein